MTVRYNVGATSGDFTVSAQKNGAAVFMGMASQKIKYLSALVTVLADTNTLTLTGHWEVSNDNSTWNTATPQNNAAQVALATGTAGADSAVTRVIEAPEFVYGWQYIRYSVAPGVATAGAGDTWSIAYCYRQVQGLEG